jgi:hypothetical protein
MPIYDDPFPYWDEAEWTRFTDQVEAMTKLTTMVVAINSGLDSEVAASGGGLSERLREWIRKLVALVKRIAEEFGAISYSIGVSLTGVTASIEWAGPQG